MGQRSMNFPSTMDMLTFRDHLRYLLGNLERFRGGKQGFGRSVDVLARAKQAFGSPVDFAWRPKQAFGRPMDFAWRAKQGFGRPIDLVAAGKHFAGFGIDVVRALHELYARIDILGTRAGFGRGELDLTQRGSPIPRAVRPDSGKNASGSLPGRRTPARRCRRHRPVRADRLRHCAFALIRARYAATP
jgi:hypothetical protein